MSLSEDFWKEKSHVRSRHSSYLWMHLNTSQKEVFIFSDWQLQGYSNTQDKYNSRNSPVVVVTLHFDRRKACYHTYQVKYLDYKENCGHGEWMINTLQSTSSKVFLRNAAPCSSRKWLGKLWLNWQPWGVVVCDCECNAECNLKNKKEAECVLSQLSWINKS